MVNSKPTNFILSLALDLYSFMQITNNFYNSLQCLKINFNVIINVAHYY